MWLGRFAKRGTWLAVSLAAASCGFSNSTGTSTAGATDETQGETTEFFSNLTELGDQAALQALMKVHERRHPGDHLTNTTIPLAEFSARLAQRMADGNPPDVFMSGASAASLYGPLHPLNDFLASHPDIHSNIYPEFIADVTVDGRIYQLPWAGPRTNTVVYNKQVFANHHLNPPTSIAEFRTVCETLKAAGVTCVGVTYPAALLHDLLPGVMGIEAYYNYIMGGTPDESLLRNAIDLLAEVVDNYVDPQTAEVVAVSDDEEVDALMTDKTAMFFTGDWTSGNLEQLGWIAGIDYGISPPPGGAELVQYMLISLAIPANAPHLNGALNFLDTALSLEGQAAFDTVRNGVSARKDADISHFESEWQASIESMRRAKYRYPLSNADWTTPLIAFMRSKPHNKEALLQAMLTIRY